MRGDRFVVPVKAEYRSVVSGIVHDQSSSGATLFIEPMSIVEMNNELRKLKLDEQEEIERILAELSKMIGEIAREIISNQEILEKIDFIFAKGKLSLEMKGIEEIERILAELSKMIGEIAREIISNQEILEKIDFIFAKGKLSLEMKGIDPKERILAELSKMIGEIAREIISNQEILEKIDFIFAKGKLSLEMKGIDPKLNKDKNFVIKNGRHPLLDPKKVVANTIYLGDEFHTLVITGPNTGGPNTGGKTVTIKTVGLFALMTQSGLHIPADFGSSMCVYDNIFADIGDEQSIEQSLSTFSSHMTRIVSILDKVTEDSLVIFDELGAGTDPVEGAALAIAILEDVKMAGAKCIATTHYSELKNYALTKKGVENAAVEFDVETLSPTYKLLIGVPGKSNAFEISRKLGLRDYIIDRAKEFINTENIELEDLLQNVEKNRIKAEEDRAEAEKLKTEIQMIRDAEAEKLEKLTNQREKMIEKAKSEAFSITRQAKEEVDEIIKRLKELEQERASKEKSRQIEQLRKELTDSMGSLQPTVKSMIVPKVASKEIKNLKAGEDVRVITLNQEGTVVSADDKKKEAVVQIGIMKMTLPYKSLQKIKNQQHTTVTKKTRNVIKAKSGRVKGEVDLRGMNLEEATLELEKYLDDATVAGLEQVTVIHGVGTGVLKTGLQDVLKKNKHVKKKRQGGYGEGGDATVAGLEQVTVIHGVGTGVLKTGLQDVLKKNKHVKKKRQGGYGEGGVGVTIVTLK